MKKRRESINKIFALFLIIAAMFIFIGIFLFEPMKTVSAEKSITIERTENLEIEKYNPTITDDFKDDRVIVTLTSEYSAVNKPLVYQDFKTESLAFSQDVELLSMESDSTSKETDNSNKIVIEKIEDLTYINKPSKLKKQGDFSQIVEITLENPGKENVLTAIEELEQLDWVLAAEPFYNYEVVEDVNTEDALYNLQWGLIGANGIQIESAWNITGGDTMPRIKVGIFEGGVQEDHPDLRVVEGSFTPSASAEMDHGTHVAGIIGAISNNGIGIAGIAPVEIALLDRGNFVSSITWAINNNIKIINASFYYTYNNLPAPADSAHATAIRLFESYGGIFIASAGNNGETALGNTDITPQFPAGYGDERYYPDISNVISVGSIDSDGKRSNFSNYGINSVSIYAPGGDILSALPNNTYGVKSGTSMAAPHVTGVAALVMSINPFLAAADVKDIILGSADTIMIRDPQGYGHIVKKLNAYKAVDNAQMVLTDLGNAEIRVDDLKATFLGEITIPSTINGKTVISIGEGAFANQAGITKVYLPETVLTIEEDAFAGCSNLEYVEGLGVASIGARAFKNCGNLQTAQFSSSLVTIYAEAFAENEDLK